MRALSFFVVALLSGCPTPPPAPVDAPLEDAPIPPRPDTGPISCTADDECDDTLFCNGVERCRPGAAGADARGCLTSRGGGCLAGQTCDEVLDRCETLCETTSDADGDGADAIECGGLDCDDADADRFPGHREVCDAAGHDEDCDVSTLGAADLDRDGALDGRCCNPGPGGVPSCGTDCDDFTARVAPGNAEACDGLDQDCDTRIDEGVTEAGFADEDRDLHGDPSRPITACPGFAGFSTVSDDCDDTRIEVHGAQLELCDGRDNDCDGGVDEEAQPVTWYRDVDADGFGNARSGVEVSCVPLAGFSLSGDDCDDADRRRSPLAREACNGVDDDCDGHASFPVTGTDSEDDDGDGAADLRCPIFGTDCDDTDPTAFPGAPELCDARDNDCDGTIETSLVPIDWLLDRDGDGFGDGDGTVISACAPQPGRTSRTGDCDDRDADVSPGAVDSCATGSGRDDDCDGIVDEAGGLLASYGDADGDGAGAGLPALSCDLPADRSLDGGDCDDADPLRHPGGSESCTALDGLDDDCDGLVDCEDADCAGASACGEPVRIELVSGGGQTAALLQITPRPIVVRVRDDAGLPAAGERIVVRAAPGLSPSADELLTDSSGLARLFVRNGTSLGAHDVTLVVPGSGSVTVTLTATAPPPGTVATLLNADRGDAPRVAAAASATTPGSIGGLAAGTLGELYVSDAVRHCIYRVDADGALEAWAGQCGTRGFAGDGDVASAARFDSPGALLVDRGRLVVADVGNRRVRAIDLTTRAIDTLAGGGLLRGAEVAASLARVVPSGLAVDGAGTLVVFDSQPPVRVVEIDEVAGRVRTLREVEPFHTLVGAFGTGAAFVLDRLGPMPAQLHTLERFSSGATLLPQDLYLELGSGVTSTGHLLAVGTDTAGVRRLTEIRAFNRHGRILLGGGTATVDHVPGTSAALGAVVASASFGDAVVVAEASSVRIVWPEPLPELAPHIDAMAPPTDTRVAEWSDVEATVTDGGSGLAAVVEVLPAHPGAAVGRLTARTDARGVAILRLLSGPAPRSYRFLAHLRDFRGVEASGSPAAYDLVAARPPPGEVSQLVSGERIPPGSVGFSPEHPSLLLQTTSDVNTRGIVATPDGSIYFAFNASLLAPNAIVRIDPEGGTHTLAPAFGDTITGIAWVPGRNALLVAGADHVEELDLATETSRTVIPEAAYDIAVRPDGTYVWLPFIGSTPRLGVYDPATGVSRTILLPSALCFGSQALSVAQPVSIAADPRNGDIYIAAVGCGNELDDAINLYNLIVRIRASDDGMDLVAGSSSGTSDGGEAPLEFFVPTLDSHLAVGADGSIYLASSFDRGGVGGLRSRVFRIDPARTRVDLLAGDALDAPLRAGPLAGTPATSLTLGIDEIAVTGDDRVILGFARDCPPYDVGGDLMNGGVGILW